MSSLRCAQLYSSSRCFSDAQHHQRGAFRVRIWYLRKICPCLETVQVVESRQTTLSTAAKSSQPMEVQVVNTSLAQIVHFMLDTFAAHHLHIACSEAHPLLVAIT